MFRNVKYDLKTKFNDFMKQITYCSTLFILVINFFVSNAQDKKTEINTNKNVNEVSVSGGLLGVNVGYTRMIDDKFAARIDANFFKQNATFQDQNFGGQQGDIDANFKCNTLNLAVEYLPLKRSKSFKLIGGLNYLYDFQVNSTVTPTTSKQYGDIVIDPSEQGTIRSNAKWTGIQPYVAIGYETRVYDQLFIGCELGSNYLPNPRVTYVTTGMFTEPSKDDQKQFQDWINQFVVMPNFKISLAYRFKDFKG